MSHSILCNSNSFDEAKDNGEQYTIDCKFFLIAIVWRMFREHILFAHAIMDKFCYTISFLLNSFDEAKDLGEQYIYSTYVHFLWSWLFSQMLRAASKPPFTNSVSRRQPFSAQGVVSF